MVGHVVAEDAVEVVQQLALAARAKELHRAPVDVQHLDAGQALAQRLGVRGQVRAQVDHPRRPQPVKDALDRAVVLFPQRNRREFKQVAGQRVGRVSHCRVFPLVTRRL